MEKSKEILKQEEWFQYLCEQVQAIAVTKTFNARAEIVEGKWLIGKEIEEAIKEKTKQELYGKKINKMLAQALRLSEREIHRCRQFYNKYKLSDFDKVLRELPETNLTWHDITNKYLLDNPEKKVVKEREYIAVRIDQENKIIYIKSNYKDFEIKYYD